MKTFFVDTNYFLRLLLKDNERQFNTVFKLFQAAINKEAKLYTSVVVIFEIYWVLSSFYKSKKKEIIKVLKKILNMGFVSIEKRAQLNVAVKIYENSSLDLEDSYNLAFTKLKDINKIASFDTELLKVSKQI